MADTKLEPGAELPALTVTPDKYVPHRYAGASGDFNPIHIDPEFAKAVGLPRNILHGLYSMAQVARAATQAGGGDPRSLKRLSVQFRGMGVPGAGDQGDRHRARGRRTAASWSTRSPSRRATRSSATPKRSWSLGSASGLSGSPAIQFTHADGSTADAAAHGRRGSRRAGPAGRRRSGCPSARRDAGAPRRSATSWRRSRSSATSTIRTPPPGGCRPTPATATTPTRSCTRGRCRAPGGERLRPRAVQHAARGGRRDALHDHDALADDRPAGRRLGAAAAHGDDQARRGAAAPAADRAGRGDHLQRHGHQARVHVRRAGRRRPRRLGGELPERAARRHGPGRADAAEQAADCPELSSTERGFLEAIAPVFSRPGRDPRGHALHRRRGAPAVGQRATCRR